jgi:hypothetical protein
LSRVSRKAFSVTDGPRGTFLTVLRSRFKVTIACLANEFILPTFNISPGSSRADWRRLIPTVRQLLLIYLVPPVPRAHDYIHPPPPPLPRPHPQFFRYTDDVSPYTTRSDGLTRTTLCSSYTKSFTDYHLSEKLQPCGLSCSALPELLSITCDLVYTVLPSIIAT